MEYYATMKINELQPRTATWLNLGGKMWKKPDTQEHTLCDPTDAKLKNKSMPFEVTAVVTLVGVVVGGGVRMPSAVLVKVSFLIWLLVPWCAHFIKVC